MEEVLGALQGKEQQLKLDELKKFNKSHQDFTAKRVSDDQIEECLQLIFDNIEDEVVRPDLLLFCKTVVRDSRVSSFVTPHLFCRLLEIAQLANIAEDFNFNECSLQARRAVFNITYHNSLCQAACYEAEADLNLFVQLQTYDIKEKFDNRLLICKMAFLFTAVSSKMRERVVAHHGLSILQHVMIQSIFAPLEPHPCKITLSKKRSIKEGAVCLSEEDVMVCTDLFMAVFNMTIHWDRTKDTSTQITYDENVALFIDLVRYVYLGLNFSEKSDLYQRMVAKFLPIMINAADQFPNQFLPEVEESYQEAECLNRSMLIPKQLLKQLEAESGKSPGDKMVIMSLLSILNKLTSIRACRKYLRGEILPSLGRVTKRPEEESGHVKSKIVKLMTHVDNSIAVLTSELLFVICKYNAHRMIKYTGYGNSAGLFNRHGLLGLGSQSRPGDEALSADEESDTEEYKESAPDLDLVTAGPARENTTLANMTEEEKEREANKLLNLIDDMHRKGVIKPGGVGLDGKVKEMDIAEQIAKIPEQPDSAEEEEEELKLDSHAFFPRNKPT